MLVLMLVAPIVTPFLPLDRLNLPTESGIGFAVAACSIAALWAMIFFAMQPWKLRPASTWMLWWLAGTVVRLIGAPIVLISIYFSSHLPAMSVLIGGVVWAVVGLLTEAVIVARSVSRQTAFTLDAQRP